MKEEEERKGVMGGGEEGGRGSELVRGEQDGDRGEGGRGEKRGFIEEGFLTREKSTLI